MIETRAVTFSPGGDAPERQEPMIDPFTLQHLSSYIAHVIPRDNQDNFQGYAIEHVTADPGYWEDKGWDALYVQWLKLHHRY